VLPAAFVVHAARYAVVPHHDEGADVHAAQVSSVKQLSVTLSHPTAGIASIRLDIPRKGPAHYELLGQQLPAAGTWKTRVTARVSEFAEYTARTTLRIRPSD
jgi:hypothetical protein